MVAACLHLPFNTPVKPNGIKPPTPHFSYEKLTFEPVESFHDLFELIFKFQFLKSIFVAPNIIKNDRMVMLSKTNILFALADSFTPIIIKKVTMDADRSAKKSGYNPMPDAFIGKNVSINLRIFRSHKKSTY